MCEQKTGGPEAVEGPRGEDLILENRLVVYLDLLGFGDKSRRHHDAARPGPGLTVLAYCIRPEIPVNCSA